MICRKFRGRLGPALLAGVIAGGGPACLADPGDSLPTPFAGEPAAVWAAGYAAFVQRFCRQWERNTDALMRAGANPTADNFSVDADWGENGRFSLAYRAGAAEAESAKRADPSFCSHPLEANLGRNRYLASFLQPRRPDD